MRLPYVLAWSGRHSPAIWSLMLVAALLVPAAAWSEAGSSKRLEPPEDLQLVEATRTSLTLSWHADHGRRGDGYAVLLDETSVATTGEPRYEFDGLRCGTSYTLGVEALDSSGNRSDPASVVSATSACPEAPHAPSNPEPKPTPSHEASSSPAPSPASVSTPPDVPAPVPMPTAPAEPDSSAQDPGDAGPLTDSAPPGPPRAMSWDAAGAFVWHETALDPAVLGRELRENGFGWIAVQIHDGMSIDPLQQDWVRRFRAASGLPVGGWGVLRTQPEQEARLADGLVAADRLDFYIANAEAEYKFSNDDGQSGERFGRSERFVREFRALDPTLPAALSSYCRADRQDIDWGAWATAGFAFLPQAYANELGSAATPGACVMSATGFFARGDVHPTIGMYRGHDGRLSPEEYATQLADAHVVGFSVYLADNAMNARDWRALGDAIRALGIAEGADASDAARDDAATPARGVS